MGEKDPATITFENKTMYYNIKRGSHISFGKFSWGALSCILISCFLAICEVAVVEKVFMQM